MARFMEKVSPEPNSGCWLWLATTRDGQYGDFWLEGRMELAHRAAFMLMRGPIPTGLHVLHRCDTPACVNPDHLWLGDHADNMRDRLSKGRAPDIRGERAPRAKLTAEDVLEIRRDPRPGAQLASEYDVDPATICAARSGRTWAHV